MRSIFGTARDPQGGDFGFGQDPADRVANRQRTALPQEDTGGENKIITVNSGGQTLDPGVDPNAGAQVHSNAGAAATAPEGTPPDAAPVAAASMPPPPMPGAGGDNSILAGTFVSPSAGTAAMPFRTPQFAEHNNLSFGPGSPLDASGTGGSGIEELLKRLRGQ